MCSAADQDKTVEAPGGQLHLDYVIADIRGAHGRGKLPPLRLHAAMLPSTIACQALGPGEAAESDALQGILAGNGKSRASRQKVCGERRRQLSNR